MAALVSTEILYHISGIVARRKLASARQILGAGFGHCADFGGRMFHSARSDRPHWQRKNPGRTLSCPEGGENLFRGLLFCDCCGHPLALSRKKLKDREVDIYLCTHHNRCPDECPKTHIIYHEVLCPYVLEQIRALARSMKRRKVNSTICNYANQGELTLECLQAVVERIEVRHLNYKA